MLIKIATLAVAGFIFTCNAAISGTLFDDCRDATNSGSIREAIGGIDVCRRAMAADQGNPQLWGYLARAIYGDTMFEDVLNAEALELATRAADRGDAVGLTVLGDMYSNIYVSAEADYPNAALFFRLAADQENTESQYNLARLYQHGVGVPKSTEDALYWYQLAAAQDGIHAEMARDALADMEVLARILEKLETVDLSGCSGPGLDALEAQITGAGFAISHLTDAIILAEYVPPYADLEASRHELYRCASHAMTSNEATPYIWPLAHQEWARRFGRMPEIMLFRLALRIEQLAILLEYEYIVDEAAITKLREDKNNIAEYFSMGSRDANLNLNTDFYMLRFAYLGNEFGLERAKEMVNAEGFEFPEDIVIREANETRAAENLVLSQQQISAAQRSQNDIFSATQEAMRVPLRLIYQGHYDAVDLYARAQVETLVQSNPLLFLLRATTPEIFNEDPRYSGIISQYVMVKGELLGLCGDIGYPLVVSSQVVNYFVDQFGNRSNVQNGAVSERTFWVPVEFRNIVLDADLTKAHWYYVDGLARMVNSAGGCESAVLAQLEQNMLAYYQR